MGTRNNYVFSAPGWVVDSQSIDLNSGRQIDWAQVTAAYENSQGIKELPDGTILVELASGKVVPRALGLLDGGASAKEASGILLGTAVEGEGSHVQSMHGMAIGGVIYKNLLPESGDVGFDTWLGEVNNNGTGLITEVYADSRI